jgi:thiamine-phosphate pyrophosphorylase
VIEGPIVAEGALDPSRIAELTGITDFIALGEELWSDADPAARLSALADCIT